MIDHSTFFAHVTGDVHVLQLMTPDLSDRETIRTVEEELAEYLRTRRATKCVLDFGEVRFLTSEMLSALLRFRETVREQSGAVRLANLATQIREVFEITRLERIFPIDDEVADARAAFAADES